MIGGESMSVFYLGIDASKGYADFVILNQEKQCVEQNFQLDDTGDGHSQLHDVLFGFLRDRPDSMLCAAAESTGGYENNWLHTLYNFQGSLNIKTARLNPEGVNADNRAELTRNGTDKMSARAVAVYLVNHPKKVHYQQGDPFAGLRKQWTFYQMLIKQRTQLYNQLESLMYSACPELLIYNKNGVPAWVLKLLMAYPTSTRLSRAQAKTVAKIPYVSQTRAGELIEAAQKSIASATDPVTENVIKNTAAQILHLDQTAAQQIKLMEQACDLSEIKMLTSFSGIGIVSAIGLMLEIQSISRFKSTKKLASFFGVHPVYKQSGDGSWGFRMSKKGRKEPRRILFMITLCAIKFNPLIKEIYEEHVQNGMNKTTAIGLCMHKILRIVFGMLKNNTPFDPDIDRKNRKKSKPTSKKTPKDKSRRYQAHDKKAPVSRRQTMKRKKLNVLETSKKDTRKDVRDQKTDATCISNVPDISAPDTINNNGTSLSHDDKKDDAKEPSQVACQRENSLKNKSETMAFVKQILA
jgi:transposase